MWKGKKGRECFLPGKLKGLSLTSWSESVSVLFRGGGGEYVRCAKYKQVVKRDRNKLHHVPKPHPSEELPMFVSRSLRAKWFLCRACSRIDRCRSRAVCGRDGKIAAGGGWSNKLLGDSIRENLTE